MFKVKIQNCVAFSKISFYKNKERKETNEKFKKKPCGGHYQKLT